MAEGGIAGSKPSDPRGGREGADSHGKEAPNGKDGQAHPSDVPPTPQQVQQGATEQFQKDVQPPIAQKPSVAATEGAAPSGSAQSQPGKETIAPTGKQSSSEVKPASPEVKAANSPASSSDKTVSSSSTKPPDTAKTDVSGASQVLPNTTLENPQPTQKKTYSETGSHLDSGKNPGSAAQAAERQGPNSEQAKANSASSARSDVPLGGPAREQKDSQAPPIPKAQENTSQNQNQNPKLTNYENKAESKSGSIPPPVPIPTDINTAQKNQNPASAAQKPETAPIMPLQDSVPKIQDAKNLPADIPKQNSNDGKPGPEVAQGKNPDSPRSSPAADELGSNNSTGREGRLVPEPNTTTDANVRGGTGKEFDVAHENTTRDALSDTTKSQSQIKTSNQDIVSDKLDTTLIEKNRENQQDSPVVPIGKRDGKEPIVSQPDGTRDPKVDNQSGKDKNADIANKTDIHLPGNEASSASMGAGFEGRPGRMDKSDPKAETIERGETFKMLDGKTVKLDLSDKATCKQLLDLANQIETNKFKQLDPAGRERLNLLLEMRPASLKQLNEVLTAFVIKDVAIDSRIGLLLQDKLEPGIAERSKQQVEKILELERSNSGFKQIVVRVSEALEHFLKALSAPKKELEKEIPDAQRLVLQFTDDADPMPPEVREFVINMKEILPKNIDSLDVLDTGKEETQDHNDTPVVTNSTKVDPGGNSREQYLVQDKDTPQLIALKCFNNAALGQLIWEINKPEATYSADTDKIRNRDFLAGERIHLPTYDERQEFLKLKGAPHDVPM